MENMKRQVELVGKASFRCSSHLEEKEGGKSDRYIHKKVDNENKGSVIHPNVVGGQTKFANRLINKTSPPDKSVNMDVWLLF